MFADIPIDVKFLEEAESNDVKNADDFDSDLIFSKQLVKNGPN